MTRIDSRAMGDGLEYLLWRQTLADGDVTTVYGVRYPRSSTAVRVLHFPRPQRLDVWCVANGIEEAVVGGFFLRDPYRPLGELWIGGRPASHEPIAGPFGPRRGAVVIDDGVVSLLSVPLPQRVRRATCCRPGRCSSLTGLSCSTGTTIAKASRLMWRSSTRTSPSVAIRVRRSESGTRGWLLLPAMDAVRTSTEG